MTVKKFSMSNPFKTLASGFAVLEKGAKRFTQVADKLDEIEKEEQASVAEMLQKEALRTGTKPKKRFVYDDENQAAKGATTCLEQGKRKKTSKGREEIGPNEGNQKTFI